MGNKWIYTTNEDNSARYTLGEYGTKMLACLGVNPSTACPEKLDGTVQSVQRIANYNGFDGYLMLNLYPQRATDPNNLHKEVDHHLHQVNLEIVGQSLTKYQINDVWLAYGNLIQKRPFLRSCFIEIQTILDKHATKLWIVPPLTKLGSPRHPLYLPSSSQLQKIELHEFSDLP